MKQLSWLVPIVMVISLAACTGRGTSTAPIPTPEDAATPPALAAIDPATFPVVQSDSGMAEGVLGIYYLTLDPADPLNPVLTPARSGAAQGDVTYLSARPFLKPDSLSVVSSANGPAGTTDYTMRFTHPFALPADLAQPSTSLKRIDLHVFDVMMVVAKSGTDAFFGGEAVTNLNFCGNPNGFRQIGPLLDLSQLGVTGTNVFPYRVFTRFDPGNPQGNFDAVNGWLDAELLAPTGYDVIPQGSSTDSILRLQTSEITTVPIIVMGKYLEPKVGANKTEKHPNRLPNPAIPNGLKYFLPEAAGDLQATVVTVAGSASDGSSTPKATVTAKLLDWDNAATVAASWPDYSNLNKIRKNSAPFDAAVSAPLLKGSGSFAPKATSAPYGNASEWIDLTFDVNNVDLIYTAPVGGGDISALLRVRDSQDYNAPAYNLINESLQVVSSPPGFEPSTRYQRITIHVDSNRVAPDITAVSPLTGISGQPVSFSPTNVGGPIDTYQWGFGGGATPNTSSQAAPSVTMNSAGTYPSVLIVTNAFGSDTFNFDLVVQAGAPTITGVTPLTGNALRTATFSATTTGPAVTSWEWTFGAGATPSTSTAASPAVTLGTPGVHNCSVKATNAGGSHTYDFQLTLSTKKIGMNITVIRSSATTWPTLWYGLSAWNETAMKTWCTTYLNPVFRNAGIEFDPANITFNTVDSASLFNIDNSTEYNTLWNSYVLNASATRLRLVVINAMNYDGSAGAMTDASCNANNTNRGCWAMSYNNSFQVTLVAHELGHILNLPHIRTSSPINSQNFNLMSYGTTSTALSSNITRETGSSCYIWSGNPMNQFQVVNNWTWTYMP